MPATSAFSASSSAASKLQLLLGGSGAGGRQPRPDHRPGFDEDGLVDAVERTVETYRAVRTEGERFLDTYRRVGIEPFKEAIYG